MPPSSNKTNIYAQKQTIAVNCYRIYFSRLTNVGNQTLPVSVAGHFGRPLQTLNCLKWLECECGVMETTHLQRQWNADRLQKHTSEIIHCDDGHSTRAPAITVNNLLMGFDILYNSAHDEFQTRTKQREEVPPQAEFTRYRFQMTCVQCKASNESIQAGFVGDNMSDT